MDLRTLKYLASLSDHGSFTEAAKEHFVTQPAISIQLRKLQEELGLRLFDVEGRRVRFTGPGRRAVEYARRFAELEREFMREMADMEGLRKGALALGTIDAASIYVLPGVFSRFNELYPGIEVNMEISSTLPLLDGLRSGRLDLVVCTLPVDQAAGYEVFPVYREKLAAIAPPGHALSRPASVPVRRLGGYPFISFQKGSVTRKMIEEELARRGVSLRITMAIDSQEAIRNLVASGFGLSILPEWTIRKQVEEGTISEISIADAVFERSLGLIVPAGRYIPGPAKAFLGIMRRSLGIDLPDAFCIDEGSL